MSGDRSLSNDVDIDLRQLFAGLARNWLRILVVALVVTGAALAYAITATPHYRAETRILIENRESVFTRPSTATGDAERVLLDEEGITSQVEVISSPDILREVARDLDLARLPEFGGGGEASGLRGLLVTLGLRSNPAQASVDERVLRIMREKLDVWRVDRSRVIVIRFSSEDPQLAADVPNAIADAYISVQQQARRLSDASATDWLEPEIADLRDQVRDAEARVAAYRTEANLQTGQANTTLAGQELSELSSELTRVRAARSAAEARAEAIRDALSSGASADALPDVVASGIVQRLRERQFQLSAEIADLSATLLGNHPRIRALRAQQSEVTEQLRREMRTVLDAQENEAAAARQRELSLVGDVNRLKAEAARASDAEVELRALEREASSQRALLESYLTRFREAASRTDRNYLPVDARVFARATPPSISYFPRTVPIVGAAFVGSLLLLAVAVLLTELFSGRAMRAAPRAPLEPIEEVAMPRVAAFAGPESDDEGDAVETAPRAELSIAEAADRIVSGGATRAIFASPEGDDATATSVMVAREIADSGLRVIFLDMTYSGAPSTSMLETNRFPGITNLLSSEAQFSDIIRGDYFSEAHVIPVGTSDPEQAMRSIERLPIILQSLATAYDVVVVECGPADAKGVARLSGEDAMLMLAVIDPEDEAIATLVREIEETGDEAPLRVTPVGHERPNAPSGRSAA